MGLPVIQYPPTSDCFHELLKPRQPTADRPIDRYPIKRIVIPNPTSTVVANESQQSLTGSDLTQEILYDDEEEETFDQDVDTESISSTRPQYQESLEKVTDRYAGISHLEFMHGLDQPVSSPLVHGLEFNNHAGISQHSIAPNYLPDPCYSHYLVNDLDRAVMLEYNILICESIMKTAGQQFSKELARGLLSCDETDVWMSNRSQLMNLVQNIRDAVRGFKPSVPFQTLQMLSNFLQDRYLGLLEPRQNYGQDLQFFYHANKQLKATLASLQAWVPSTSQSSPHTQLYLESHPTMKDFISYPRTGPRKMNPTALLVSRNTSLYIKVPQDFHTALQTDE